MHPALRTQRRRTRRRRIGVPVLRLRAASDRALGLCAHMRGIRGARAEREVIVPVLLCGEAWGNASAYVIRLSGTYKKKHVITKQICDK